MVKKILFATSLSLMATSAHAAEPDGIIEIIMSLASQTYAVGNLVVVLAFCAGLFCLYKAIEILMNRDDDRQNPLSALPMYFIGASIGIGFGLSSDLVQNTIFGASDDHSGDVVFKTLNEFNQGQVGGGQNIPNQ